MGYKKTLAEVSYNFHSPDPPPKRECASVNLPGTSLVLDNEACDSSQYKPSADREVLTGGVTRPGTTVLV